jgi:exopolyphosphatase/pppGpp-phosphohydrolase
MSKPPARIRLEAQSTLIEFGDGESVTLGVGPRGLAEDVLRHEPPTPAELERAIDLVEDALTVSRLAHADRGALAIADTDLLSLPGLAAQGASLTRDDVEALFQQLAARAVCPAAATSGLPHGRDVAAALLILRECMHHLGFDRVIAPPA